RAFYKEIIVRNFPIGAHLLKLKLQSFKLVLMVGLVDCNNFYVSCERTLDPSLNGKPVVVLSNNDGVVISRSNEVKALGVGMAGPAYKYRDLFKQHHVRVFSANFNYYMQISEQVMKLVREYSP